MESVSESKACSKCGETKITDDFYFKNKMTGRRFGWCKACHNRITIGHYRANIEEGRRLRREYAKKKRVEDPEAAKIKERESHRKRRGKEREQWKRYYADPAVKEKKAAYRAEKKAERTAYNTVYKKAHKDQVNAEQRARYRRNREKVLEACRTKYTPRYAERTKAYREKNSVERAAYNREWRRANSEKAKDSVIRRRCRILKAEGSHTATEWVVLKVLYGNRCLCCGRPESEVKLHRDHIVPLTKGGSNRIDNIQPLCRRCNSRKSAKAIDYRRALVALRLMGA